MFCYQCERTAGAKGCAARQGVCGKTAEAADLQDGLVHVAALISRMATRGELPAPEADRYVVDALFATVTNVDFDPDSLRERLERGRAMAGPASPAGAAAPGIQGRRERFGAALAGVLELGVYGLKGAAAYLHHAARLGYGDAGVHARLREALAWFALEEKPDLGEALARALAVGEINLKAMELLDAAHTETFGHPEPTSVRVTPVAGKCVLVSGHDLKDLRDVLRQTEGRGLQVYTHGEMLPANAYPGLKSFRHLAGNYGGAWQDQRQDFAAFPGAILMTTNCLQQPLPEYRERLFTTGLAAIGGVRRLDNGDFGPVAEAALAAPGFTRTEPAKTLTVGFGRKAVETVADRVVAAVKSGAIRHFFLVGGCDGPGPGRGYFAELVEKTPKDTVVLTLACGKYRFNKGDYGAIGGIPRLLDVGQCNDAWSAIQIALALSKAFGLGVNELPLSLALSWYEQKAVAILLSLFHLGIRNIRLGPGLPAFLEPEAVRLLADRFGVRPTTTAEADLRDMLSGPKG